ncbi:alpha-tocopherol transfer protein-like isoform X1 [Cydia pomonella]|uniref:alpha-tocopherol transfer protein-like isoform X1 n=2 Tax=Cydia pomonella TaxID=82600 RepID=UPI002ADDFCFF|nr:alpha-tocopherol transfer protein-like isoform X1 [Cydia pomonella]
MDLQYEENGTPFVMWGDNKIQLENWPIKEKFYTEKAETELRETPEVVAKALRELRELLKGEKNLNIPIDNDDFLMKFLRPCKFYADSALKKIQAFYKFRQAHETYCHDLMPSVVRAAFDHSIISILAPRDQHGRRIMFVESGKGWDPRAVPLSEVFRGVQLGLEAAMTEPRTQVSGVIVIMDMQGLSLSHVLQFTPSFAKMVVDWVQDCTPIRLKAVHIVYQPYVFNMVFALFKPFLREKLRSRIHFHGNNMNSLKAHVDGKALRPRHGGSLPEMEVTGELLWKMLSHYEDGFKEANSYGYVKINENRK